MKIISMIVTDQKETATSVESCGGGREASGGEGDHQNGH